VSRLSLALLVTTLALPAARAAGQSNQPRTRTVVILPTAGLLSFGNYFTGPGGVTFSNQDGIGYGAELSVAVWKDLSLIGSVLHASSDWSFEQIPLLGSVSVDGASLWFYDAGLRYHVRLGATPLSAFGQVTAGAIRYAVDNVLLSGHATNFAVAGGLGVRARVGQRFSAQGLVKDYVASFKSVDQAAAIGVVGRRAHTLAILLGLGFDL
jgi:hypothetical protein